MAIVTGMVVGMGPPIVVTLELLDSNDLWMAGDWKENILGRKDDRSESKRPRVFGVF